MFSLASSGAGLLGVGPRLLVRLLARLLISRLLLRRRRLRRRGWADTARRRREKSLERKTLAHVGYAVAVRK